jgi:hypothetical protein
MEGEGLLGGGKGEGGKCDALLRPTLRHSIYITALTLSHIHHYHVSLTHALQH